MRADPRSWAEALLGFASAQDVEEKRALALESAAASCTMSSNEESARVARYLDDPGVASSAKTEALAAMLPGDGTWGAFCELLVRANACRLLSRIAKEYRGALDRKTGVERVLIESARPLDSKSLEAVLQTWKALRKPEKIIHSEVIVPGLIGGFRFSSGSIRYDVSIAGKLARLKAILAQPLPRTTAPGEGRP